MNPKDAYGAVMKEIKKHIAGKDDVLKLMFVALVANGHVILEGVPGVAKTTMTKTLASTIDAEFGRIQGTPDIEIKDIIGFTYIDENHNVQLKKGPIFTNILLIDELNRVPPKTTTALLESLEEKQVTLGTATIPLKNPFITFVTQNPLNIEGTNPLPKVLTDRFLMRIAVTYPSMQEEQQMLRIKEAESEQKVEKVLTIGDILSMQEQVNGVKISDEVIEYVTQIVDATRNDIHVVMGASPRAEIAFLRCSKALALVEGRNSVSVDDIKFLAKPVLSHRIVVKSTGGLGVNGVIDGMVATLH